MERTSGGQTSVGADAKLLSSHAGDPRTATGDTTKASQTTRSAAWKRVSPPPARGPTRPVGRHRPGDHNPDTEHGKEQPAASGSPGCRCMWRTAVATYIVRVHTIETAMAAATDRQSRAATSGSPTSTRHRPPVKASLLRSANQSASRIEMEHRSTPVAPWAIRADPRSPPARARHASSLARRRSATSRISNRSRQADTQLRHARGNSTPSRPTDSLFAPASPRYGPPCTRNLAAPRYAQPVRPPAPAPVSGARRGRRLHPQPLARRP